MPRHKDSVGKSKYDLFYFVNLKSKRIFSIEWDYKENGIDQWFIKNGNKFPLRVKGNSVLKVFINNPNRFKLLHRVPECVHRDEYWTPQIKIKKGK